MEQSVLELLETSAVELLGVLLQKSALGLLEELVQALPGLVLRLHMSM